MKTKKIEFLESENGCFVVTSHVLNKDGYCNIKNNGINYRAHRLIYQECFGEIPKGLVVRHKCDVRSCINPEHLELGTQLENARDRTERNRSATGERNGSSVINNEIARKIKLMLRDGFMPTEIARKLNVSRKSVRGIKESNMWKHVKI